MKHPRLIYTYRLHGQYGRRWSAKKPAHPAAFGVRPYRLRGRAADPGPGSIYLQPWCDSCAENSGAERQWCEEDDWGECELTPECHARSIRYEPV